MTAEEILHRRVSPALTDKWALPVKQAVLAAIQDARDMGYKDGWTEATSVAVEAVNHQYGTPKFLKKPAPMSKEEVKNLTHRTSNEFARDENLWK